MTSAPVLDPQLLEILRCPQTRSELTLVSEGDDWFLQGGSGLRYPIVDGVPVMLIDAAHPAP